jgi:hypothetical protein
MPLFGSRMRPRTQLSSFLRGHGIASIGEVSFDHFMF